MATGYWILIGCIAILIVLQIVRDRRAAKRITELESVTDRMKDEFREHETELRRYKDTCRDLLAENDKLRSMLEQHAGPETVQAADLSASEQSAAEHLQLENMDLVYKEGLIRGSEFSDETLVRDLRSKAAVCDVEATLLCFDSGIRMSFACEKEEGSPVLRVILRVPEGGACCIYEEGKSDPEEDWPPVRACLDTIFARGREVYLSYEFGQTEERATA